MGRANTFACVADKDTTYHTAPRWIASTGDLNQQETHGSCRTTPHKTHEPARRIISGRCELMHCSRTCKGAHLRVGRFLEAGGRPAGGARRTGLRRCGGPGSGPAPAEARPAGPAAPPHAAVDCPVPARGTGPPSCTSTRPS